MTSETQARCKVVETTLQYQMLFDISNLLWFSPKNGSKSLSFHQVWFKFDDVTVTLS